MDSSTTVVLIFIIIMALLLIGAFWGTRLMTKNAVRFIVKSLRRGQALSPSSALFAAEVGVKTKAFFQTGFLRDYKPAALEFLIKNNVVLLTEDGKVYLSEEALERSGLEQKLK